MTLASAIRSDSCRVAVALRQFDRIAIVGYDEMRLLCRNASLAVGLQLLVAQLFARQHAHRRQQLRANRL